MYDWSDIQEICLQTSTWLKIVGVDKFTENPLKLGNCGINKKLKRYIPLENNECILNNVGFTTCGISKYY